MAYGSAEGFAGVASLVAEEVVDGGDLRGVSRVLSKQHSGRSWIELTSWLISAKCALEI